MTRTDRCFDRLTIVAFLLVIGAPILAGSVRGSLLDSFVIPGEEAAAPSDGVTRPPWPISRIDEVRTRWNRQFRLRRDLIDLHARLKVRWFGVSSSEKVLLGKDGWLFYQAEGLEDDFRRVKPFTERELRGWRRILEKRRDWLAGMGIPYLCVVAPNPQTIYPELIPARIWRIDGPSRLDQLTGYLHAHSDFDLVDLRPSLERAKAEARVYYKTDTHWNQLGGLIAYQEIAERLAGWFPGLRIQRLADFDVSLEPWHGALVKMLGSPGLFVEQRPILVPRAGRHALWEGRPVPIDETVDAYTIRPRVVRTCSTGEIASAVVFRDSFFSAPAAYLSEHFQRSVYVWSTAFDPQLVLRERPSVVIQEMVERQLMNPLPADGSYAPPAQRIDP